MNDFLFSKRWYEYSQLEWIHCSSQLDKSTQLIITDGSDDVDDEENQLLFLKIDSVLTVMIDIYHLNIDKESILMDTLIEIINQLPKLITLKIRSIVLSKPASSYEDEIKFSNVNEIQKVYLKKMNDIEQVHILIKICSQMNYFQVNHINSMNTELFLSTIINQDHHNLRYLCCRVPAADDCMIQQFSKMIDSQKNLLNYTMWRVVEYIYLQWK